MREFVDLILLVTVDPPATESVNAYDAKAKVSRLSDALVRFRAICFPVALVLLWGNIGTADVIADAVCKLPENEFVSEFLRAADAPSDDDSAPVRLARWDKKSLVIGVFQDSSAAVPKDPLERNLAIFKALGAIVPRLHVAVNFAGRPSDIELIFVSEAMKFRVFRSLPINFIRSKDARGCPVYLELERDDGNIRSISKAHILVDGEMDVATLRPCLAGALANAAGLAGWDSTTIDDRQDDKIDARLNFFVAALYDIRDVTDVAGLKSEIKRSRVRQCQ